MCVSLPDSVCVCVGGSYSSEMRQAEKEAGVLFRIPALCFNLPGYFDRDRQISFERPPSEEENRVKIDRRTKIRKTDDKRACCRDAKQWNVFQCFDF